jgi:hypothetical protein
MTSTVAPDLKVGSFGNTRHTGVQGDIGKLADLDRL